MMARLSLMIDAPLQTPLAAERVPPDALVRTSTRLGASTAEVWEGLMFYEQIEERPPLYLRMLLPIPIRTEGVKARVGDEARCLYEGGHLVKRVTLVDPGRRYAFEVTEQALVVGGGVRLWGGEYALREISPRRSEIVVTTRYMSPRRPRWLWRGIEAVVCHAFHRYILRAIRRRVEGSPRTA